MKAFLTKLVHLNDQGKSQSAVQFTIRSFLTKIRTKCHRDNHGNLS